MTKEPTCDVLEYQFAIQDRDRAVRYLSQVRREIHKLAGEAKKLIAERRATGESSSSGIDKAWHLSSASSIECFELSDLNYLSGLVSAYLSVLRITDESTDDWQDEGDRAVNAAQDASAR